MNHPCVELYFQVETGPLFIRIWLKTDDVIRSGRASAAAFMVMDSLKTSILNMACITMEPMVEFLEMQRAISAFQVCYRHDSSQTSVVVYREWP